MKTTRFLLALSLAVTVSACEDNLLDTQPLDTFSEENVWNDLGLVELFVNSTYNGLIAFVGGGAGDALNYAGYADNVHATHGWAGAWNFTTGVLSPIQTAPNPWNNMYERIRNANIFMERIDDVPVDVAGGDRKSVV